MKIILLSVLLHLLWRTFERFNSTYYTHVKSAYDFRQALKWEMRGKCDYVGNASK